MAELVVSRSRRGAYPTLAGALAAAGPSAVLLVEPGVYAGTLSVRDRTVVVRAVDGPGTVTLETRNGEPVVEAARSHVVAENVTLATSGRKTRTTVDVTGGTVELTGCSVSWEAGNGVIVRSGARGVVTGCRIHGTGHGVGFVDATGVVDGCDFTGETLCGVSVKLDSSPHVRNCTFRDVEHGFMAFEGAGGTVEDCRFTGIGGMAIGSSKRSAPTVRRCHVSGGPGSGIFVGEDAGGVFEDCAVADVGDYGIALRTAGSPVVRRCRVERPGQHGLFIGGGRARVEDVVVERAAGWPVLVQNGDSTLVDVSVTGGATGIAVTGEHGTRVKLEGGSVCDTTDHAVLVMGGAKVIAERTVFSSRATVATAAQNGGLVLVDCTLRDGTRAVSADDTSFTALDGCTVTDIDGSAVVTAGAAAVHAVATTVRCTGDGLVCDSTGEATLEGCDLTGVAGTPVTGSHAATVVVKPT